MGCRRVDHDLQVEMTHGDITGFAGKALPEHGLGDQRSDGAGQTLDVTGFDQHAVPALVHHGLASRTPGGDQGRPIDAASSSTLGTPSR